MATTDEPACTRVDSSFLRGLLGYNTRRATLKIFASFAERTSTFDLKPVEFSVLHLIGRNPNVSPGQLCAELALLPPHLAKILQKLSSRNLVERSRPERDRRSIQLRLSAEGETQLHELETVIATLEREAASRLTDEELGTLIALLQKIYE